MKVYVLESGGCNDWDHERIGIFSTREKAEQAKEDRSHYNDWDVEEVELDTYLKLERNADGCPVYPRTRKQGRV